MNYTNLWDLLPCHGYAEYRLGKLLTGEGIYLEIFHHIKSDKHMPTAYAAFRINGYPVVQVRARGSYTSHAVQAALAKLNKTVGKSFVDVKGASVRIDLLPVARQKLDAILELCRRSPENMVQSLESRYPEWGIERINKWVY